VTMYRDKEILEITKVIVCNDVHEAHLFIEYAGKSPLPVSLSASLTGRSSNDERTTGRGIEYDHLNLTLNILAIHPIRHDGRLNSSPSCGTFE